MRNSTHLLAALPDSRLAAAAVSVLNQKVSYETLIPIVEPPSPSDFSIAFVSPMFESKLSLGRKSDQRFSVFLGTLFSVFIALRLSRRMLLTSSFHGDRRKRFQAISSAQSVKRPIENLPGTFIRFRPNRAAAKCANRGQQ